MDVTIQDLGAIGEFAGSIAVLVTLVYLAYQTRATRQATELQMILGSTHPIIEINNAVVGSNPECAEAIFKASSGQELTETELAYYSRVTYSQLTTLANLFLAPDSASKQRLIAAWDTGIRDLWANLNFVRLCDGGFLLPFPAEVRDHVERFRAESVNQNKISIHY